MKQAALSFFDMEDAPRVTARGHSVTLSGLVDHAMTRMRLAVIPILFAARFVEDLFRDSLELAAASRD